MKKILFFLVALVCATVMRAQEQRASLTHGGDVKYYYGALGFAQAMGDAEDGDVINLSGGEFNGVTMDKAVTVRGAGVDAENPTVVQKCYFGRDDLGDASLRIEGVKFTGETAINIVNGMTPTFVKCDFENISSWDECHVEGARFINCRIMILRLNDWQNVQFFNSFIAAYLGARDYISASFINCAILDFFANYRNCTILNSILYCVDADDWRILPFSSTAINCVAMSSAGDEANHGIFEFVKGHDNTEGIYDMSTVFASTENILEGDSILVMKEPLKLTQEAATKYLGTDGTQIGLYGGYYPYNTTLSYPRITKMDVSPEADADGMIKVEIEVSNPE